MAQQVIDRAKNALSGQHHGKTYNLVGHEIGSTGYGLMGLTWRAEPQEFSKSIETMRESVKLGANFWNGGELYGTPEKNSLHLLREYFVKYPEDAKRVVISIKGGAVPGQHGIDGSAKNVQRSVDECLKVLDGKKKLDIFECARVDPNVPIESSMKALKKYIDDGKLGGISLSECSADSIRRAAKVVKVSAVEVEYSLWETTAAQNGVFSTCAELGIPIVAYSPLGRGFLTGQIKAWDDIPESDLRRHLPRFSKENFPKNLELVKEIEKLSTRKGCKPGQLAMAWVKAQSQRDGNPIIIPIPGTTTIDRLKENMVDVELSENDVKELDSILASFPATGDRYHAAFNGLNFGDSRSLREGEEA